MYLSAPGSSAWASHFNMAQKTTAVQSDDKAKTIVSTAENQNVSVKVKAKAPIKPAAIIIQVCEVPNSPAFLSSSFLARAVMVQNKNIMVAPLANADIKLVKNGTLALSPIDNSEKAFPSMANKG